MWGSACSRKHLHEDDDEHSLFGDGNDIGGHADSEMVPITDLSLDMVVQGGSVAASLTRVRSSVNRYTSRVTGCDWFLQFTHPTIKAVDRRVAEIGAKV